MLRIFNKLLEMNLEDGAELIRKTFPQIREEMKPDGDAVDFDFMFDTDNFFTYRTSYEEVENDAPNIDSENGHWSMIMEGDLISELADVELCIEQIKMYFRLQESDIETIKAEKLERTYKRLLEEEK